MTLLNVRLHPEDERKAKALREAGIPISGVVRNAIRTEYERRIVGRIDAGRPSQIVAEILTDLPDPPSLPPPPVDSSDRREVRRHIAARLRRRRP